MLYKRRMLRNHFPNQTAASLSVPECGCVFSLFKGLNTQCQWRQTGLLINDGAGNSVYDGACLMKGEMDLRVSDQTETDVTRMVFISVEVLFKQASG